MENHRKMNSKAFSKKVFLLTATICFCALMPLKAQTIFNDTLPGIHTIVCSYSIGIVGSASEYGISAWESKGTNCGIVHTVQLMRYSSSNNIGYGLQLYGNIHSKKHSKENMKEREQIIYVAPQVAYLKRTTLFDKCFGSLGGGIGYLSYHSKSDFADNQSCKATCSSIGFNAFIGLEYTFAKHWGVKLEVNALYSPLNLKYSEAVDVSPFKPRDKFSLFLVNTQIGISCHL